MKRRITLVVDDSVFEQKLKEYGDDQLSGYLGYQLRKMLGQVRQPGDRRTGTINARAYGIELIEDEQL